jgi:hypothetical protein
MISACITDPFAGWLRIKDSLVGTFTSPRNGAQAAGCTEPRLKLPPTDDVCQLKGASPFKGLTGANYGVDGGMTAR